MRQGQSPRHARPAASRPTRVCGSRGDGRNQGQVFPTRTAQLRRLLSAAARGRLAGGGRKESALNLLEGIQG